MKISKRANSIQPSLTRQLFNRALSLPDVIDLTLGDPDLMTPKIIQDAACVAIKNGKTHYSANAGLFAARAAVAANIKKVWTVQPDPNNEIMITVGGMEALYLAIASVVDAGDEVVILAPYYVNYVQMVQMCGGIPRIINAYDHNGFSIDFDELCATTSDKTVLMIINSPNNPTGEVLSNDDLKQIYDIAVQSDLWILSDEVYHTILFDDKRHRSILQYDPEMKHTILVDSMSKEFSMTGWRIGYAAASERIISSMSKMQENVAACASLPSQYAMIEAYSKSEEFDCSYIKDEFETRRDYLCKTLNTIRGLSCRYPSGTFYLFLNISATGLTSINFANSLLDGQQVAVVPGEAYGDAYSGYIRIAFTKNIQTLEAAVARIKRFVDLYMAGK